MSSFAIGHGVSDVQLRRMKEANREDRRAAGFAELLIEISDGARIWWRRQYPYLLTAELLLDMTDASSLIR